MITKTQMETLEFYHHHFGNNLAVVEIEEDDWARVIELNHPKTAGLGPQVFRVWQKLLTPFQKRASVRDLDGPMQDSVLMPEKQSQLATLRTALKDGQIKVEKSWLVKV